MIPVLFTLKILVKYDEVPFPKYSIMKVEAVLHYFQVKFGGLSQVYWVQLIEGGLVGGR